MKSVFKAITMLFLCLLGLTPMGLAAKTRDASAPFLVTGQLRMGSIRLDQDTNSVQFRVRVSSETYGIRFKLQGAMADLDLIVYKQNEDEFSRSETSEFNERLFLYRSGSPTLVDGIYTIKVAYLLDNPPYRDGVPLSSIDFALNFEEIKVDNTVNLSIGRKIADQLSPENGMMKSYQIDVPANVRQLRIDAFEADIDLDMFLFVESPKADPFLAPFSARSYRSREVLLINFDSAKLRALNNKSSQGIKLYLLVLSKMDEVDASFKLLLSSSLEVPQELRALPQIQEKSVPAAINWGLEKALIATVEILTESGGGTGVMISPYGYLLTNYHVVQGNDGMLEKDLAIGFSVDHRLAPDSQFLAEVIRSDKQRDLALLQIKSGFYGQALPQGYRFPFLEIAGSSRLRMGEILTFIGYPSLGGLGSRSTITLTKGIVSGFENRGFGTLVKTDAQISSGNSGGAALDGDYKLVGLPTLVMSDKASHLAYIYPTEIIPAEWRQFFAK